MELRAGYKKTEAGLIPNDWNIFELGEHLGFQGGSQPDKSYFSPSPKEGFIRLIQIRDYKTDKYITYVPRSLARKFCSSDDIMIGRYGPPIFQILKGIEGAYNVALIKAIPEESIVKSYAYYFLKQTKLFNFVEKLSQRSSGQTGIDLNELKRYPIALPPTKKEQVSIATTLSDVDTLITQLEKLITKKRQIKQGAMQTLLNPFESNGELKHDWSMTTYGQAFDFLSTAAYSRADLGGGDCGYIHYGDIHTDWENHLDVQKVELPMISTEQAKPYAFAQEGDLVMADASEDYDGIGKSVEIIGLEGNKVISGLHTFLLRSKGDTFVNGFKGYIHQITSVKQQLNKMATGLKVYGVSKNNLKNIFIPRPPKNDQEKITNILRDMDAEISELACKVKKMKELKQGMMQSLLTGQIRLVDPAPKNEQ